MYSTSELTEQTWSDFEALFTQGNGWDFCWCMALQAERGLTAGCRTRAERSTVNRTAKHDLVRAGRAHGILVYADGAPVGWCQYGRPAELPAFDRRGGRFTKPATDILPTEDWRISCFVATKQYRRQGVASTALRAALAAIGRHGGGVVEAYPLDPATPEATRPGTRANYGHFGTVPMFEAAGFVRVGWLRRGITIMRRPVRPRS